MDLRRQILDQQLIDRKGELMGKVDGIMLELGEGEPPRLARLIIGGGTAARRIHPGFADWLLQWRRRWGPQDDEPLEVPWSKVRKIGIDVKVDLDAEDTSALAWERWVRDHIIGRIPGAGA
jgi:sporulation protein YlmC with PRC-barrel domain